MCSVGPGVATQSGVGEREDVVGALEQEKREEPGNRERLP